MVICPVKQMHPGLPDKKAILVPTGCQPAMKLYNGFMYRQVYGVCTVFAKDFTKGQAGEKIQITRTSHTSGQLWRADICQVFDGCQQNRRDSADNRNTRKDFM